MPGTRRAAQSLIVVAAVAAALVPRPAAFIERVYGRGVYPPLQGFLTGLSNRLPVAVLDLGILAGVAVIAWWWWRVFAACRRGRGLAAAGSALAATATLAAAGYLWFLAVWGLNYARPPIEVRLGLAAYAPTERDVVALLDEAVVAVNVLYRDAWPEGAGPDGGDADLALALHAVEALHGRPRPTVPGTPKPTLLAPYFRMAGVDGLTAPLALETLLNPDLTAAERPFVLAHEWAHLAGYAPEADANFVAWLVAQAPGASPHTRYSGWLFLVSEAARQVPTTARRTSMAALAAGPRQDLADIAARMASRVELVERVGWRAYDSYLRSQGVDEGVRSYSRVVELIVRAGRARTTAAPPPPR